METAVATITLALPEQSTAWRLLAKGITTDTLAGEAAETLIAKKDLFGELKLPPSFTDGDQAEVVATIHNEAVEKGPIQVTLRTTIGGRTVVEQKNVAVSSRGIREVTFSVGTGGGGRATGDAVDFMLTVAAAGRQDVLRRSVPLLPYGLPVYATATGVAASDTTAWVEAPSGTSPVNPTLSILVGPTVERSLLDVLLAPAPPCQFEVGRIASDLEAATSDLMAAVGLQKLLAATRPSMPEAQELDARIRAGVSLLDAAQNDDGGWSWTGRGGLSDRYATSRAVWALSLARKAGYHVPDEQFHKAVAELQNELVATPEGDYETKTILLHALATVGKADFAVANRLYRERQRLSAARWSICRWPLPKWTASRRPANCWVGSARGRKWRCRRDACTTRDCTCRRSTTNAAVVPVAGRVAGPVGVGRPGGFAPIDEGQGASRLAFGPSRGPSLVARQGHRPGHAGAGPVVRSQPLRGRKYTLAVFVNDRLARRLDIDAAAGTQSIEVPRAMLKHDGRQRIRFQITGRGRFAYQCILAGFVPVERLRGTTRDWQVTRTFEPAPLELDGRDVRADSAISRASMPSSRIRSRNCRSDAAGWLKLNIERQNLPDNAAAEQLEYLVVTEPIPAGATIVEQSVRGGFERFEISPGAITFYIGNRRRVETISYEIRGYVPGDYRAAPTVVRNAYRPDAMAVAAPKPLGGVALGGEELRSLPPHARGTLCVGPAAFSASHGRRRASV